LHFPAKSAEEFNWRLGAPTFFGLKPFDLTRTAFSLAGSLVALTQSTELTEHPASNRFVQSAFLIGVAMRKALSIFWFVSVDPGERRGSESRVAQKSGFRIFLRHT
jgi:hypothetical protein